MPRLAHRPVRRFAALLLAAGGMTACASGPGEFLRRPATPVQWPPVPAEARVAAEFVYHGTADVDTHPGFFARLFSFAIGSADEDLVSPCGIASAADGTLYIADTARALVHRLDVQSGAHTLLRGSDALPLAMPIGVALGPDDAVFVTDSVNAHIVEFRGGVPVRALGDGALERPTGIAYDAAHDRLLVTDTTAGRVVAFARDGATLATAGQRGTGPGEFNHPTNLAVAPDGTVLVTDSMNFRVQTLDAELRPLRTFGQVGRGPGTFASPKGIAVDPDGHVWVVDAMFDNVQVFAADGTLLLAVGATGHDFGGFHLPTGIHIDGKGRVVVADAGNARIQVFQYLGEHAHAAATAGPTTRDSRQ